MIYKLATCDDDTDHMSRENKTVESPFAQKVENVEQPEYIQVCGSDELIVEPSFPVGWNRHMIKQ